MFYYSFSDIDRVEWLRSICEVRNLVIDDPQGISFVFENIPETSIRPEHLVPLACLIEHLNQKGIPVSVHRDATGRTLLEKYNLREYWGGKKNYSQSVDQTVLNLQRVLEDEKEFHGIRVSEYLKNRFFQKKDLTPVGNSLTEAYYNIFDHAKAKGNAFSMLSFDREKEELYVAVCDFGIGIARTVKEYLHSDMDDASAIEKAMENNFTIRSTTHNSGQGLGNILGSCTDKDTLWIISNSVAIAANSSGRKVKLLGFEFEGTLIFYSMSLSHFDDEEILDDFNL